MTLDAVTLIRWANGRMPFSIRHSQAFLTLKQYMVSRSHLWIVWHGVTHRIVVEFDASLAHLPQERRYHPSQKIHILPDASCRVIFDAAGLPDLAAWIASFGGRVRAIEPEELVQMVRDLHRKGLDAHGKQNSEKS